MADVEHDAEMATEGPDRRVHGPLLGPPVGLVHLLFDDRALERAVRERVRRVDVHVVIVEKPFEFLPLSMVRRQGFRRWGRQAQAHAEWLVWRDARFHLWQV